MGESLGKVSEGFPVRADLLGVEAEVIRVAQHLLEEEAGLFESAGTGQRFDQPERADAEQSMEPCLLTSATVCRSPMMP